MISNEALSPRFLDDLLVDVINRCKTIQNRSSLLSHSEFASDNPGKLAKLIGSLCHELANQLVVLRAKYARDPINVFNEVRIIDDFVRDLGAQLRYVDGAIATKVPWSLPQPLERLCEKLLPGTNLMLRPQWKYNYTILISDLNELYRNEMSRVLPSAKVQELFAEFPTNFHIISFPSVERRNVLLHCDLGHEIGHLVAKRFLYDEAKNTPYLINLRSRIAERVRSHYKDEIPLLINEEIARNLEKAAVMRWRGFAEIISDMFAMRLFGPAALFALFQMALSDSLDLQPREENSYYPPWRKRLRQALSTLENAVVIPVLKADEGFPHAEKVRLKVSNRLDEIRALTLPESDQAAIDKDWVVKMAYASIDEAIPQVEQFLTDEYGTRFLNPSDLYKQVYPLIHRLAEKLPPNSIETSSYESNAVDLEAILNAAWFYRISFLDNAFPNGDFDEAFRQEYAILNRLTLKAIEYSHVQQVYKNWESQRK